MGGHLSHLKPEQHSEILETSAGPIKGNEYRHDSGKIVVDGYLGIPYANPVRKFQKAQMADLWLEPRDCTKYGPICSQFGTFSEMEMVQKQFEKFEVDDEKCLNLNVFAPRWKSEEFAKSGRPVMVFIHGGAFECGTSASFDDYSLSASLPLRDIILVTINYRVGLFGFLTDGSKKYPGNLALWDQTLALEWVQKHIASFGGNPGNVTIFGQSAGGGSVDLLSLSPKSRDLFHKWIPMSGAAMCHFSMRKFPVAMKNYQSLAESLGFPGGPEGLVEFFEAQSTSDIKKAIKDFKYSGDLIFGPTFDGDFFPQPLGALRKDARKKPAIFGLCEYEGLLFATHAAHPDPEQGFREQLERFYNEDNCIEDPSAMREKVYAFYTRGITSGDKDALRKALVNFIGDQIFNTGIFEAARNAARCGNDVYVYSFEYHNAEAEYGALQHILPFKNAATHCTDLRYLLGDGIYTAFGELSAEDREVMERMGRFFGNFAKYGNPNEAGSFDWSPLTKSSNPEQHYRITLPECEMRQSFQEGRLEFLTAVLRNTKNHRDLLKF